jgi:hypothetical protein
MAVILPSCSCCALATERKNTAEGLQKQIDNLMDQIKNFKQQRVLAVQQQLSVDALTAWLGDPAAI